MIRGKEKGWILPVIQNVGDTIGLSLLPPPFGVCN